MPKQDGFIHIYYYYNRYTRLNTPRGYVGGMKTKPHATTHDETLHRLRRIAGQVEGVRRMVEDRKYCIDILTQIQAARSALRAVELQILKKHVDHCVRDAFASGAPAEADRKMDELLRVMKKPY